MRIAHNFHGDLHLAILKLQQITSSSENLCPSGDAMGTRHCLGWSGAEDVENSVWKESFLGVGRLTALDDVRPELLGA